MRKMSSFPGLEGVVPEQSRVVTKDIWPSNFARRTLHCAVSVPGFSWARNC